MGRGSYNLLSVNALRNRGATKVADWLEICQDYWEKRRTEKSELNYPLITSRLDHNDLLTNQDPNKRYVVIYNARGANAMAHVIDKQNLPQFKVDSVLIKARQFVADTTNMYYETDDKSEAHYLSSMINCPRINKKVKAFQPRGNYGFRDIYRRPLMLSIPKFNSKVSDHRRLVSISIESHEIIKKHSFIKKGFKGKRNEALKILTDKLNEIDTIVQTLLNV